MRQSNSRFSNFFVGLSILVLFSLRAVSAQQPLNSSLRGQITDSFGATVPNAVVTAITSSNREIAATADSEGNYIFPSLRSGVYTIKVNAEGFSPFEKAEIKIETGRTEILDVVLSVASATAEVTINADEPEIGTAPDANADALVLRGNDLDALPDDPEDLNEALQSLAEPAAGPDASGQVLIDGFSGGNLPPKESIREIRVNRNPFAAEFDRLGYGRVEILTKPGTNQYRGQAFFNFNDESLNSRSPFAAFRAPYQARRFGGNLSGSLIPQKASFFLNFERREVADNSDINAIILDVDLNPLNIYRTAVRPTKRFSVNPRLDWQLNETNTLVARYSFEKNNIANDGVGGFNLESRNFNTEALRQNLQLTATSVFNKNVINELRFQYWRERRDQTGGDNSPTIRVLDAFTAGGAQIGVSFNYADRLELQNFTSWTRGNHSLKAGFRYRFGRVENSSEQNFAGTYTFGGGTAPQLDAANQIIFDGNGTPLTTQITSLERYRRTLFLRQKGFSAAEIRQRGGGATQFSISDGNPFVEYSQSDFSPFVQDDWRVRPNLTVSLGLRYDFQQNIKSLRNFAPRVAVAWSPKLGDEKKPTTVLRGGFGFFYNNFNESLLSQTRRFDGISQKQYIITNASADGLRFLDLFPAVPTVAALEVFSVSQTVRRLADDLQTPLTMQYSFGIDRQLPYKTTFSVNFVGTQTENVLRSRNVNAPLADGVRPLPNSGNIFQFESSGNFQQKQLIFNLNNRFSRRLSVSANYVYSRSESDSEGLGSFPVNQYDLSDEYSRSILDIPHRLTIFSTLNFLPFDIRLNPSFIINSGRPFNIIVGRDINRDALFTERPAFADEQTTPGDLRTTPYGNFDINPKTGQTIIPRNFGTGAPFSVFNLRINKQFGFGKTVIPTGKNAKASEKASYFLDLSANIQNLLNNTNEAIPIGNLSSPFFGASNSGAGRYGGIQSAGNRRIELQLRFSF